MKITIFAIVATAVIILLCIALAITKHDVIANKPLWKKIIIIASFVIVTIAPTVISILFNIGYVDLNRYKTPLSNVVGLYYIDDKHTTSVTPDNLEDSIANIRYDISGSLNKKTTSSKIDINSTIASKKYLELNPTKTKQYYRLINFVNNFISKNQSIDAYKLLGDYSLAYVNLLIDENESNQDKIFNYTNVGINAYLEYMKFNKADITYGYNQIGMLYQTLSNYINDILTNSDFNEEQKNEFSTYRNKLMILSYSYYQLAHENSVNEISNIDSNDDINTVIMYNLSSIECDIGVAFDNNQVCLDWFSESLNNTLEIGYDLSKVCNLLSRKIAEYSDHANALGLKSSEYYLQLKSGTNPNNVNHDLDDNKINSETPKEETKTENSDSETTNNE